MSKQEELRKILVVGATCTLIGHTVNGKEATNGLTNRKQLIVEVDEKAGVKLMLAEPKSTGEQLHRRWEWPDARHLEITKDGYSVVTGGELGDEKNPRMTWTYKVDAPEDASVAKAEGLKATEPAKTETVTQTKVAKEGGEVVDPATPDKKS